MQILLDTSLLLWALTGNDRAECVRKYLINQDNQIYFSSASIWEISIKNAKGKLKVPPEEVFEVAVKQQYEELPICSEHTIMASGLSRPADLDHSDPFDRILIAQAKYEGITFFTSDSKIARYNEPCVRYFRA